MAQARQEMYGGGRIHHLERDLENGLIQTSAECNINDAALHQRLDKKPGQSSGALTEQNLLVSLESGTTSKSTMSESSEQGMYVGVGICSHCTSNSPHACDIDVLPSGQFEHCDKARDERRYKKPTLFLAGHSVQMCLK